ncbi:hypothetical protein C8R44DRAFT_865671 [Mycena epipterygia]|nr:hypothetical protein C8R44DRAFT_865671 [Mycena epipterygia]
MTAAKMMRYRTTPPSPAGVWRAILSVRRELARKRLPGLARATASTHHPQNPLTLYVTLLSDGKRLSQAVATKGYIHVVQTSGYNTGKAMGHGESVGGLWHRAGELTVDNVGETTAEVLLFDIE